MDRETRATLSSYYEDKTRNYRARTNKLCFLLMPLVFIVLLGFQEIYLLGFPTELGGRIESYLRTYSNFVFEAFFIIFGFFALLPDSEKRYDKVKKEAKRIGTIFLVMLFSFIALNVIYCAMTNNLAYLVSENIIRKRTIFNFVVFNVWPLTIGNSIWFIQSLFFAYLFFWLMEKLKLQKLYAPVFLILALFTLATGEFAGFTGFPHFEYNYIPGGTLTRAIPYMLIGMFLRKNVDKLSKIPRFLFLLLFPVGLGAAIAEFELLRSAGKLVYQGHCIGFGIMALSLCCFAIAKPMRSFEEERTETKRKMDFFGLGYRGRKYAAIMYALCQPVSFVVWFSAYLISPEVAVYIMPLYNWIVTLLICFVIVFFVNLLNVKRLSKFNRKLKGKVYTTTKHLKHEIKRAKVRRENEKNAPEEEKKHRRGHFFRKIKRKIKRAIRRYKNDRSREVEIKHRRGHFFRKIKRKIKRAIRHYKESQSREVSSHHHHHRSSFWKRWKREREREKRRRLEEKSREVVIEKPRKKN